MLKNLSATGASPKKIAQGLAGFGGLILICGSAGVLALNSQISALRNKADTREAEVGSSEQVAKRFELTQNSYNETLEQIKDLESSVSQSSYVPTLLQQLQALAASTHLTVSAVRPLPPPPPPPVVSGSSSTKKKAPPPYDTLDISVDVKGTYANTSTFLYSLTRFPKIVSVSSAQMRPESAGPDQNPLSSPTVATSLHLTAYVFHDDTAVASSAAPATVAANAPAPASPPATNAGAAVGTVAGSIAASKAAGIHSAAGVATL
ncbi:MAG: hypothetical protein ABIY70_23835 [Capsulimonas sp.]|uniref:hypothetical protein n=1 Tax=Capsulimonas sp. TaxID=2494211 RepID=UPI003266AC92